MGCIFLASKIIWLILLIKVCGFDIVIQVLSCVTKKVILIKDCGFFKNFKKEGKKYKLKLAVYNAHFKDSLNNYSKKFQ